MELRTEITTRIAPALALVLAALLVSGSALAQQVYRWIDEDGNVHYTESLPPGYKDTGHDVLNERGIVVDEDQRLTPEEIEEVKKTEEQVIAEEAGELPRDSSGLPRPKPLYSEAQKQVKMDNFLMLRYESEQEILDAMNVEIRQLNYDRRLLEGTGQSMNESYRGQIRVAADKQRAGQAVKEEDVRRIEDLRTKLADNAESLSALEVRENSIRETFQAQLERYRFLIEKYADENSG